MGQLEQIWSEQELIKKFGLKQGVTGRSATIGSWIAKGLPYVKMGSARRYFFEDDVVTFMKQFRKQKQWLTDKQNKASVKVGDTAVEASEE
jgi:hypothetical protein